jgi:transcriptional regulator with XRE-family HTH domain
MSVAVYPRLNELLRAKGLSVAELERQIEQRFGLSVDPKTLYRLASSEPIQRADLEIVGAVAAVLGIGLDDLFAVYAVPRDDQDGTGAFDLAPAESQRLADLFERQARGSLSEDEQHQLEALVADYGRRLHERRLFELARQRGISVDQARREAAANLNEALAWWRTFAADPARRRAVISRARRGRKQATE